MAHDPSYQPLIWKKQGGSEQHFDDTGLLVFGDDSDVTVQWDGTDLHMNSVAAASAWNIGAASFVINTTLHGTLTVGVDGTGYDVTFFGDTSGCSLLYDQSEDQLVITGPADVPGLKLAGAGSFSPGAYGANGTAWADTATPAFIADQRFLIVDYGGTLYRLPVWANA